MRTTDQPRRSVHVVDASGRFTPNQQSWLASQSVRVMEAMHLHGELRIRVVDDREMASAHERHTGVPGTTDVLTFDLSDPRGHHHTLDTDLLICLDEAIRQAAARGIDPARELLLYVVHGVLHCAGFDDADDDASDRMHAREDEILASIGVGSTFALAEAVSEGKTS